MAGLALPPETAFDPWEVVSTVPEQGTGAIQGLLPPGEGLWDDVGPRFGADTFDHDPVRGLALTPPETPLTAPYAVTPFAQPLGGGIVIWFLTDSVADFVE